MALLTEGAMSNHYLDYPTLTPGAETTAHDDERLLRVPALTIVWHPDPSRIGESAILPAGARDLSRLEPTFTNRSGSGARGPLADPYLSSREPYLSFRTGNDCVEIAPGHPLAHIKIEGARLERPLLVAKNVLDRGLIITLARRIVLCLHLAQPERAPARRNHGLIGGSDIVDEIRREIDQVADLDVPVLIQGESGTGKGIVAAALVAASRRAGQPFLSLNMGATVPSTAASELFGHERGSFTGANVTKLGLFAAADGGSLLLDEIGLMPLDTQPVLLDVLETGQIRPVGSSRARKIDVRFLAATDTDLDRAIAAGRFSEALLQRLARYQITVPPLRDRREDFGVLLVHFLRAAFEKHGEPDRLGASAEPWLPASTVAALVRYDWPGNIRELENVAGKIVVSSRGQTSAILPSAVRLLIEQKALRSTPARLETAATAKRSSGSAISDEQVADALARSNGSASRAAKILGVSRTTYYELRKRNPALRSVTEIPDEEILVCRDECDGDVPRMAARLRVPIKALKDRLAHLSRSSD